MSNPPPQQLGRYQLHQQLGTGGMGAVYKAWDTLLTRWVAVKVLHSHVGLGTARLNQVLEEARLAAQLQHKDIVRIYDVSPGGPPFYIVSELAEGRPLAQWLAPDRPLPNDMVGHVIRHVASALDHAHQNRIIHRDVKPGNIMVHEDGRVMLLDFGLARFIGTHVQSFAHGIVGTPSYMSPEQIRSQPLDPATDIYNLGLVAYEMLTGRPAFAGAHTGEILDRQLHQAPPPPEELNPNLSPQVCRVLARALDKDPAQRPETAGEFARELSSALKSATAKLGAGSVGAQPLRPPPRRNVGAVSTLVGVTLAVALLLGVVAMTMMADSRRKEETGPGSRTTVAAAGPSGPSDPTGAPAPTQVPPAPTAPDTPVPPVPTQPAPTEGPAASGPPSPAARAPSATPAAVADRCQAGLSPPRLLAPEPEADCSAGCVFRWAWDTAPAADEYFQVQFRPDGTSQVRGLHAPTRGAEVALGGNLDKVFRDLCGSDCGGRWSVAVVRWDGQNPSQIGCTVTRSEWRPGRL